MTLLDLFLVYFDPLQRPFSCDVSRDISKSTWNFCISRKVLKSLEKVLKDERMLFFWPQTTPPIALNPSSNQTWKRQEVKNQEMENGQKTGKNQEISKEYSDDYRKFKLL